MVLPFSSVTHTFSLSSFRACSDIARAAVAHASLSPFRACSCSGSFSVGHRRSPPRTSQLRPCSSLTHIDPFVHSFTFSVFLLPHQPDAGLAPLLRVGISALLPGKATFYYKLFQTPSPCDTLDSGTDSPLAALAGLARRPHWPIILRSPRPHRSLDQTWMSRLWSCLSRRVSSFLFWSPGEPPLPPATKVSGWRRWLQR